MENVNVLISKRKLNKRLKKLAKEIDKDYLGKEITAIVVLKGAVYFASELTLKMKSKMQLEFIKISSYSGRETTNCINNQLDIDKDKVEGKDVLIIEDIVDTGHSMDYLLKHIKEMNPNTLKLCVLLNKPSRREVEVPIDYLGFEVPNKFIVGYGFDDEDGTKRNLDFIGYKD